MPQRGKSGTSPPDRASSKTIDRSVDRTSSKSVAKDGKDVATPSPKERDRGSKGVPKDRGSKGGARAAPEPDAGKKRPPGRRETLETPVPAALRDDASDLPPASSVARLGSVRVRTVHAVFRSPVVSMR